MNFVVIFLLNFVVVCCGGFEMVLCLFDIVSFFFVFPPMKGYIDMRQCDTDQHRVSNGYCSPPPR